MATHQYFLEATKLFYENQYEKGIQKINVCIQANPDNAMLLSNRSLFYSQMGHLTKAMQDLQKSIQLDHLNYVSYFNLFSLLFRTNKEKQSLMNLCCSLSCLYLTRARFRKRQLDAQKAIRYAQNNVQAHVLKGLMHLQNNRIKLALNQLDWAYQIDKNNQTLNKIRKIIKKKSNLIYQEDTADTSVSKQSSKRLISTYQPVQEDLMIQIKMKISQFNDIYNDLNQEQGALTQRVPRTLLPNQIQQMAKLNLEQPISEIYQLKYKEGSHGPVVYQMKQNYRKQKDFHHNQLSNDHQFSNDNQHQNFLPNEDLSNEYEQQYCERNEQNQQQIEFYSKAENQKNQLNDDSLIDNLEQNRSFSNQIYEIEVTNTANQTKQTQIKKQTDSQQDYKIDQDQNFNQESYEDYLVVQEYPSNIQINSNEHFINNRSEIFDTQVQNSKNQQGPSHSNQNQNQSVDYSCSQISSREGIVPINLYPMKSKTYGRFKVIRLDHFQKNNPLKKLQEMYCKLKYQSNQKKEEHILTTCDSLFSQELNSCEWNQVFRQIQLSKQPSSLIVQIYCKNFESYKDDLYGEGQVLIQKSGQIKLDILSKKKLIGQLNIKLYII